MMYPHTDRAWIGIYKDDTMVQRQCCKYIIRQLNKIHVRGDSLSYKILFLANN